MEFPIQMYDPKREYNLHKTDIDNAIHEVLNHGKFINGPEINELEDELSKFTGSQCVTLSNGTDALQVALLALDVGIDDEVITVSHSWISTVEVISILKAKPVFVDIEPITFNMDPSKLENVITGKTKAIIVVSLYGHMADYDKINEIANKYNIPVIEDGAQSFGATYKNQKSCSMTPISTTSFFPSKPLGCYGDGGACFTNIPELEAKIRAIKNHGGVKRFHHKYIGMNARLDTIQAAILNTKLKYFEETIKNRNACANYYTQQLQYLEKIGFELPKVNKNFTSVWAQYSILAPNIEIRDNIVNYLKEKSINVSIFYPSPLHLQECFNYLGYKIGDLPVTESVCDRIFNLPCYGELTNKEQVFIIDMLRQFNVKAI
jgi:UDP-2-acetamido-2-deoxy-ribo-hexuluronate aminotransferase